MFWIVAVVVCGVALWQLMRVAEAPSRESEAKALRSLAATKPGWMAMYQAAQAAPVRAWGAIGLETVVASQAAFERLLGQLGAIDARPSPSQLEQLRTIVAQERDDVAVALLLAFVGSRSELHTHREDWAAFAAWGPESARLESEALGWKRELQQLPATRQ